VSGRKDKKGEATDLIARFEEGLISGKMNVEEGEWIIGRLQNLADDAVPRVVEMLASPGRDTRHAAIVLLRELGDPRAVRPLRRILHGPNYSDGEKLEVIRVLDALGSPIDEATFRRAIPDPEALIQDSVARMLEVMEDPAQVEALLEVMEEGSPEMQEQYVRDILGPLVDRRLLLLLTVLLHSEHDAVVVAAVDAIERLKEPAVIPLLEERAQYDPSPNTTPPARCATPQRTQPCGFGCASALPKRGAHPGSSPPHCRLPTACYVRWTAAGGRCSSSPASNPTAICRSLT